MISLRFCVLIPPVWENHFCRIGPMSYYYRSIETKKQPRDIGHLFCGILYFFHEWYCQFFCCSTKLDGKVLGHTLEVVQQVSNALLRRFANSRSPPTSVVLLYIPELKVTFAVALGIKGFTSHALFGLLLLLQRQFKPYIYSLGTGLVSKELVLGFKIQSVGKSHKIVAIILQLRNQGRID